MPNGSSILFRFIQSEILQQTWFGYLVTFLFLSFSTCRLSRLCNSTCTRNPSLTDNPYTTRMKKRHALKSLLSTTVQLFKYLCKEHDDTVIIFFLYFIISVHSENQFPLKLIRQSIHVYHTLQTIINSEVNHHRRLLLN